MIEFRKSAPIASLRALWKEAFGDDDTFLDLFFGTAYSENRGMAAFVNNKLAGALYWFDFELNDQKIAYIYAIATAKALRGLGVSKSLLEHTHAKLKAMGYAAAILVPGNDSLFKFYEKNGYKTCGTIGELKIPENIEVTEIPCEDYLRLRKNYTPKNSPIFTNSAAEFLKAQYSFFKGEDFLLCKAKDAKFIAEFLGTPPESSPQDNLTIARTNGATRPFLMGLPFDNRLQLKDIYFPFAFD